MAKFLNSEFKNATVVLDGNEYIGCNFLNSRIVVTRGNFVLNRCSFRGCTFEFGGEAENIKILVAGLLGQKGAEHSAASQDIATKREATEPRSEDADDG